MAQSRKDFKEFTEGLCFSVADCVSRANVQGNFVARSGSGQPFDPKPKLEDYIVGEDQYWSGNGTGNYLVDLGDPEYLFYYDVLGNAIWGLLAGEFSFFSDGVIVWGQGLFAENDDGDDIMVQVGLDTYNLYGKNATLEDLLTGVLNAIPRLKRSAHDRGLDITMEDLTKSHIVKRSDANYVRKAP